MARIRHIAIGTQDPEATARFYIEGLGLKEVGRLNSKTAEGYYLSDGHVNVAILKFKDDDPATTEGAPRYIGVHHFGVEVEDMAQARARIEKAGAVHRPYPGTEEMKKRGNIEVKFSGPDGVTIDLSEHGWLGTKKPTKRRDGSQGKRQEDDMKTAFNIFRAKPGHFSLFPFPFPLFPSGGSSAAGRACRQRGRRAGLPNQDCPRHCSRVTGRQLRRALPADRAEGRRAPGAAIRGGQSSRGRRPVGPATADPICAGRLHRRLRARRQHGDRAACLPEGRLRHVQGFRAGRAIGVQFSGAGRAPQRAVQVGEGPRHLRQGPSRKTIFRQHRRRRLHPFLGRVAAHPGGFTYLHVPYKSVSNIVTEIVGGRIDATISSFISLQPHIASSRVRLLGIGRATRSPKYPEFPTIAESLSGYENGGWFGFIAPAGTPREIVMLLNREMNRAMTMPDVREKLDSFGLEIHTETPEYFTDVIRRDFDKWGKLTRDIGFKPR